MDWHEIAIGAIGLLVMAYGYLFHSIVRDQKALEKRMTEHERELPEKYVRRDDFAAFKRELLDVLNRIESKLDNKADRL